MRPLVQIWYGWNCLVCHEHNTDYAGQPPTHAPRVPRPYPQSAASTLAIQKRRAEKQISPAIWRRDHSLEARPHRTCTGDHVTLGPIAPKPQRSKAGGTRVPTHSQGPRPPKRRRMITGRAGDRLISTGNGWYRSLSDLHSPCPRYGKRSLASCIYASFVEVTEPWRVVFAALHSHMRQQNVDICLTFLPLLLPKASITTLIQYRLVNTKKATSHRHQLTASLQYATSGWFHLLRKGLVKMLLSESENDLIRAISTRLTQSHTCNNGPWCDSLHYSILETEVRNYLDRSQCFRKAFRAHKLRLPTVKFCSSYPDNPCDLWKAIKSRYYPSSMIIKKGACFRGKKSPGDLSKREIGKIRPVISIDGTTILYTELREIDLTWINWDQDHLDISKHV